MNDAAFYPSVYAKKGCPFSFKVRLFLLEAGLLDRVKLCIVDTETPEGQAIRAELDTHLEKTSFPVAELEPGRYVADSDLIIGAFKEKSVDQPVYTELNEYVSGPLSQLLSLYRENLALKEKQPSA